MGGQERWVEIEVCLVMAGCPVHSSAAGCFWVFLSINSTLPATFRPVWPGLVCVARQLIAKLWEPRGPASPRPVPPTVPLAKNTLTAALGAEQQPGSHTESLTTGTSFQFSLLFPSCRHRTETRGRQRPRLLPTAKFLQLPTRIPRPKSRAILSPVPRRPGSLALALARAAPRPLPSHPSCKRTASMPLRPFL